MLRYIPLAMLALAGIALADEPGWTDAERGEKSDAVFVGTVRSVEKVSDLNANEELRKAVVIIKSVTKGEAIVGRAEEKIVLYFEHPKDGQPGKRCPSYVTLKPEQRATFFVRMRKTDNNESRPLIEMGSDVRDAPAVKKS